MYDKLDFRSCKVYDRTILFNNAQIKYQNYFLSMSFNIFQSISTMLGSGNFGVVMKGTWDSPNGSVPVALKTVKQGASEEEKIKFLQEGAIMGQFHHPNIIQMHGVVTMDEPVCIR